MWMTRCAPEETGAEARDHRRNAQLTSVLTSIGIVQRKGLRRLDRTKREVQPHRAFIADPVRDFLPAEPRRFHERLRARHAHFREIPTRCAAGRLTEREA